MLKALVRRFREFFFGRQAIGSNLSRYLTSSNHFSREKQLVKPAAFMPCSNRETGVLETSVYQVSGLSEEEVWGIGRGVVVKSGKTLYGLAAIQTEHVEKTGLSVQPDNIPPRHANIVRWPSVPSEQKLLAVKLAGSARLKLL